MSVTSLSLWLRDGCLFHPSPVRSMCVCLHLPGHSFAGEWLHLCEAWSMKHEALAFFNTVAYRWISWRAHPRKNLGMPSQGPESQTPPRIAKQARDIPKNCQKVPQTLPNTPGIPRTCPEITLLNKQEITRNCWKVHKAPFCFSCTLKYNFETDH